MSKTKVMPFGGSTKWLQQRDDEMAAERALPTSVIRNSEPYQVLLRQFEQKEKEIVALQAQLAHYEQAKIARRKPSSVTKSTNRGRPAVEPRILRDNIWWLCYNEIARLKGFEAVSSVSRQVSKKGLKRQRFEDGAWRIPAAQVENIERRAYNLS